MGSPFQAIIDRTLQRLKRENSPIGEIDQESFTNFFAQKEKYLGDDPSVIIEGDPYSKNYFHHGLFALMQGKRVILLSNNTDRNYKDGLLSNIDLHRPLANNGKGPGPLVIFSSGSSGPPKGVEISFDALLSSAERFFLFFGHGPVYNPLPQNHIGGWMASFRSFLSNRPCYYKKEQIIADKDLRTSMVPTQVAKLIESNPQFLKQFNFILLGGAECPPELLKHAQQKYVKLIPSYGLTESGAVIIAQKQRKKYHGTNTGELLPNVKVKLINGRLAIQSHGMLSGVWQNKKYTSYCSQKDYYITHDKAILRKDSKGNTIVTILGRSDLIFQSGGENCDPIEIERLLLKRLSPLNIDQIIIVPTAHKKWGMAVVAFLPANKLEDIQNLDNKELLEGIPRHFRPKYWLPLPKKSGIKYSRHQLTLEASQIIKGML